MPMSAGGSPNAGWAMSLRGFCVGSVTRLVALLVVALLISAGPIHADEIEDLDIRAFALHDAGKTSEGIELEKQALTLAVRLHGPESDRAATLANNLGLLYSFAGRHPEAEQLFRQSIQVRTALF